MQIHVNYGLHKVCIPYLFKGCQHSYSGFRDTLFNQLTTHVGNTFFKNSFFFIHKMSFEEHPHHLETYLCDFNSQMSEIVKKMQALFFNVNYNKAINFLEFII
jgi:hypothetical protein